MSTYALLSYFGWILVLGVVLVGLVVAGRRSKAVQDEAEEIAARALPEIGEIAEKQHMQRFGRAPTSTPESGAWYPPSKGKVAKHA